MIKEREFKVQVECRTCGDVTNLLINEADFTAWFSGELLIQNAFPYLSADERELLISQTCGDCWDRMFDE
jgi:hypothetical protein